MRRVLCILLAFHIPFALAALDLNKASVEELDALPGVGPSRAQAIVDYRTQNGPFGSVEDLQKVKGIGDKTLAELKPLLLVETTSGVVAAPSGRSDVSAAESGSGFPWWLAVVVAAAALAAFAIFRRRAARAVQVPQPVGGAASAGTYPLREAAPASPPRPAGAGPASASVPPARPAGAPPRPAGSAPASQVPDASVSSLPPKPAGAPPKPAGAPPDPTDAPPKPAGGPPKPAGSR